LQWPFRILLCTSRAPNRTICKNTGKTGFFETGGAECGALFGGGVKAPALDAIIDPDLAEIIDAWARLSDSAKADILTLVRNDHVAVT